MKSLFLVFILMPVLSACSLYKSEGRKQFDSQAPSKISGFALQGCHREGKIETWLNQEFPNKNYELVSSDSELEIWKTNGPATIEVRASQKDDSGLTTTCTYLFASEEVWSLYRTQFVKELENNVLMTE
jgi:hypothetical protein